MAIRFSNTSKLNSVLSYGIIYLLFFFGCRSENNDFILTSDRNIKITDFSKEQTLGFKSLFIKSVVSSHFEGFIEGDLKLKFNCLNKARCIPNEVLLTGKIDTTIYMSNFYDKTFLIQFISGDVNRGSLELSVNF